MTNCSLSFLFIFLMSFLNGCNYLVSQGKAADPAGATSQGQKAEVGFQMVFQKVIGPRCTECHSDRAGNLGAVNLETYANTLALLQEIRDDIMTSRMPKNRPPLNAEEKQMLLAWIDAGGPLEAPGSAGEPVPNPTPTPAPVPSEPEMLNYQLVDQQVLRPRCIGCHSEAGGNRGGINLESFENVFKEKGFIKDAVVSGVMPPRRPLSDEQKRVLLNWIDQGAPK
jgi:uncharacterized membrane protein